MNLLTCLTVFSITLFMVSANSAFDFRNALPHYAPTSAHSGSMPLAKVMVFDDSSSSSLAKVRHDVPPQKERFEQQKDDSAFSKKGWSTFQPMSQPVWPPRRMRVPALRIPPVRTPPVRTPIRSPSLPVIDSTRYLGVGRRNPDEEVFPSAFLRDRAAKLHMQEEYDRIQRLNPDGRWYFFVPSSPIAVETPL